MADYSPETRIDLEELPILYEKDETRYLEDGSVLHEYIEDHYSRKYPNGQIAEYRYDYDVDELLLTGEEYPDGRLIIYDYKEKSADDEDDNEEDDEKEDIYEQIEIYRREANGDYTYHRYEKDYYETITDLLETITGNINDSKRPEARVNYNDLPIIREEGHKKLLADSSVLEEKDDNYYIRKYPNGHVATYYDDGDELNLMREEAPDGSFTIYDYIRRYNEENQEYEYEQVTILAKDAKGHYVWNEYKRDYNDRVTELVDHGEGETAAEYLPETYLYTDELEILDEIGNLKILKNGALLIKDDDDDIYTMKYPNGQTAEYHYDHDNFEWLLSKEKHPDGRLTVYDYKEIPDYDDFNQFKIYERKANGDYTYYLYDRDDDYDEIGDLLKTIKGNINDRENPEKSVKFKELPVVYEEDDKKLLADNSILEEKDDIYQRQYPDGRVAEYFYDENEEELLLTKLQSPDGSLLIYDISSDYNDKGEYYKQTEIYHRKANGDYTFNHYDKDSDDIIGDLIATITGNVNDEHKFATSVNFDDLPVIYENDDEYLTADGSVWHQVDTSCYRCRYPNGQSAEYRYLDDDNLYLFKEKGSDGTLAIYDYRHGDDEDNYEQILLLRKKANGDYICNKYKTNYYNEIGNIEETVECNNDSWHKKTFYDKDENPLYYQLDGDETKKYYPSGKLMEEIKDDITFCYYETGHIKSEKHPDGVVKEYAPNELLIYEKDSEGNYQKFKLNRYETGTLLIETGKDKRFNERYQYDAEDNIVQKSINTPRGILQQTFYQNTDQQLKEEKRPDGTVTSWSKRGKKTSEKFPDGSYKKFSSDSDYQKFDRDDKLLEEANTFGRTVYTYYPDSDKLKHITKYNESDVEIKSAYRHFDINGNEDTAYYLERKKIIAERIEKESENARRKGVDHIKAIKKKSGKITKFFDHIRANRAIKNR